jgi:AraC-like DNA-binding protein
MKDKTDAERFEFSFPPDLPGVQLAVIECSTRMVQMVHETYTTAMMIRGARDWNCNGEKFRSTEGMVQSWQPGDAHHCLEPSRVSQRGLLIQPEVMEGIAREAGAAPARLKVQVRQLELPVVTAAFRGLYESLDHPRSRLERQSRFLECMRLLLKHAFAEQGIPRPDPVDAGIVRKAKAYIRDNFQRNLGLDELADVANVDSPYRLIRSFKKQVGTTPHSFQIDVRLAEARALLLKKESAVTAASSTGFSDQSHFIRHFKRMFGLTPEQFRGRGRDR